MLGSRVTLVEGDTAIPLEAVLTDAYIPINLHDCTAISFHMNGDTHACTAVPSPGHTTLTVPAAMTDTIGHFHAEIVLTLDGNAWYFPSEGPLYVEILPHTHSRA